MKITTINSIELSALCDNRCIYCPAPIQHAHRPVGLMTMETFIAAIEWVKKFTRAGTQRELNLFGVGEPTLNPLMVEMVAYARNHCRFEQVLHTNTNGNTMGPELARDLKNAGISQIDITGHNAHSLAKTIRIFKAVGIEGQLSMDFATNPNNWAGQVDWFEPDYDAGPCPWVGIGQAFVMWNGDVSTCCIDAFGKQIIGNIFDDDLTELDVLPGKLCETCHHTIEQEPGRIIL